MSIEAMGCISWSLADTLMTGMACVILILAVVCAVVSWRRRGAPRPAPTWWDD